MVTKCSYCGVDVERNKGWVVSSGSPAGDFLGLEDGEETRVHDSCMDQISSEI